jgi:hypothetical protein
VAFSHRTLGIAGLVLFLVGAALFVVPLTAPVLVIEQQQNIVLQQQNFIFYRWFGLARTQSALIGMALMAISALTIGWLALAKSDNRVARFFRIADAPKSTALPVSDVALVLAAAILAQIVYLFAIPLGFECDASMFYNFAKAILGQGQHFSPYRPPAYPIFLIFTGVVWPGTFLVAVLAQAAMGVAIPFLVYAILHGLGRRPALIGAFAVILSTTPFVAAKLMLSEQLYVFTTILTVFFLARYQDCRDPRAIYGFVMAGLAAMLTRWEAQFIFAFGFVAIFLLALGHARQMRHAVVGLLLTIGVLGSYSTARALFIGDPRLIGSLQSGTGQQIYDRLYMMAPETVTGTMATVFGHADPIETKQLMSPENGPASRQLYDFLKQYIPAHPESYHVFKGPLANLVREPDAPPDSYQELFGRFEDAPEKIVENIFASAPNLRTAQYAIFIFRLLPRALGPNASNRLLLAATLETIERYPATLLVMADEGFILTGIRLTALASAIRDPLNAAHWKSIFPIWGIPDYSRVPFNIGGCAAGALPPHLMSEYGLDAGVTATRWSDAAIVFGGFGRNIVRVIAGTIVVLGFWVLFFAPRRGLNLPVLLTLGALIVTIGVSIGGANTRYDLAFIPLLVVAATAIGTESIRRVRTGSFAPARA